MGTKHRKRKAVGFSSFTDEYARLNAQYENLNGSGIYIRRLRYGGWEVVVVMQVTQHKEVLNWIKETFGPEGTCKTFRWKTMHCRSNFHSYLKFRNDDDITLLKLRWSGIS